MLGKLLKWEFKATARLFLPLYLTLFIFAFINRLLNPFEFIANSSGFSIEALIRYLSIAAYFALIIGVVVMTLVIMIQRFYKSLLQDEGYLSFTLPTTTWKHVLSKLLISELWTITSIIATLISGIIIAKVGNLSDEIPIIIDTLKGVFGPNALYLLPLILVIMIAAAILMIYTAISLGHTFSKHKIVASFVMYGALYMLNQIIAATSILVLSRGLFLNIINSVAPTHGQISTILLLYTVFISVGATAYFTITNYLLKNKLNLE